MDKETIQLVALGAVCVIAIGVTIHVAMETERCCRNLDDTINKLDALDNDTMLLKQSIDDNSRYISEFNSTIGKGFLNRKEV